MRELLMDFSRRFNVLSLDDYAVSAAQRGGLREIGLPHSLTTEQAILAPRSEIIVRRSDEREFSVEAIRQ